MPEKVMNCPVAPPSTVSKGVARGHVLCCIAVVFICFMLTCLNLYMMSSTRSVLRSLDARMACVGPVGRRPLGPLGPLPQQHLDAAEDLVGLTSPEALQQQQQPSGPDDFILLAPGDLDNAWTTQTGRLLVPVGQPEDEDDGWKQMQVQLAAQANAQQRHIEDLHDKLAAQYRARDDLQRNHQDLLRDHHQQLAKKDRQLLKEKKRVMKQGARHQDEVRRYQTELDQLKQQMEQQSNAQNATSRSPGAVAMVQEVPTTEPSAVPTAPTAPTAAAAEPTTVVEVSTANQNDASADAASAREQAASLDHIFSAVFGPNPGSFFFPSYSVVASKQSEDADGRVKRDLDAERQDRRSRRLSLLAGRRLGQRRRRHNQDAVSGPIMRIEGGALVPLNEPAVVEPEAVRGAHGARRRRLVGMAARAALQRG